MTDAAAPAPDLTAWTRPDLDDWPATDPRFARWERSAEIGRGPAAWAAASRQVLRWEVKTRSGFTVDPAGPVVLGDRPVISARPFGVTVLEPVEVVAVVDTADRAGFAYRTLPGHPVSGEEAFLVRRAGDAVVLTIRSLTAWGDTLRWRALYPALLVAQGVTRRRYLRALRR